MQGLTNNLLYALKESALLKFDNIKSFSDWEDEVDLSSAHDLNAFELEKSGHKVACIGRSLATIEQCESECETPSNVSEDSLKVSIYPDKDLSPTEPVHEIFIAANRWGSSDVILRMGDRTFRAKWVEDGI